MDKSWMTIKQRWSSNEYKQGMESFLEFAMANLGPQAEIRCPCIDCVNSKNLSIEVVRLHLVRRGIDSSYKTWVHHGEPIPAHHPQKHNDNYHEHNECSGDQTGGEVPEDDNQLRDMLEQVFVGGIMDDHVDQLPSLEREDGRNFDKLFNAAQCKAYPGCAKTVLAFVVKMLHVKVYKKLGNDTFNIIMKIIKEMLPTDRDIETIPWNIYEAKKFLRDLGMGYVPIHACKYDCALFWKENAGLENCPTCNEPRYKVNDGTGKKIPHKILRYLPLTPRLQRLYYCEKIAPDMRWHKDKRVDDDELRHPADGQEWKDFDERFPDFAADPRNVRLGLASDGFNPFGNMSTSYSMWPVFMMPYNLPPWKCMKEPFCFMSLLIPGPSAIGRDIDIYLRPLIDELKVLWEDGVRTYDASNGQYFMMRACLLWTINDLPAYAILSGWSTKGYLACPICNEDNSAVRLRSKIGYLGARRFLPENHIWRRSKLFNGAYEDRTRPLELSGQEILEQINSGTYAPFGKHPSKSKKRKRDEYEKNLNWGKKSILFELTYFEYLILRHNLDTMHIGKNICDNMVGTALGIDGKNKDTEKARKDMEDQQIRKELHLKRRANGSFEKPQAMYTLSPKEREGFCEFLKSIKYPDGYAANISKCVNTHGGKLSGLKSHDCHVLLQRILPIGMRGYLNKEIGTALFEFGDFYQQLCSRTVRRSDLDKLQENIVLVLCKFEKIFPPAFFDVMVHLAIHLPREIRLGGPVQYRWMYPIERLLGVLKRYVTNKARPEGSIVEAYISKECTTFCSMYLHGIETVFNREDRNDDGGNHTLGLAAFNQNVRPFGLIQRAPTAPVNQRDMAHWFVLYNSPEVDPYREKHKNLLEGDCIVDIEKRQQKEFPRWFQGHDIFEVTENNVEFTPLVKKVIGKKASKIYADWKSRMSDHYEKIKEKGEDAFQHPIKGASLDEWKFMIDHIFNDPKWQPRKNAGKKNRNAEVNGFTVRSRLHTMGSKSFAVAITTEADKPDGNVPDFPERYKVSKMMKGGGWIDPQCEQLYERMNAMKEEAKELGICLPTDEEYSKKVLGEARYYYRGMGVGPKPLSSSAREDFQQVQSQMELLCEERDKEREENEKRWEDARIRHEEEREEARIRHEALQKELDTFKAIVMSQMNGQVNLGSS